MVTTPPATGCGRRCWCATVNRLLFFRSHGRRDLADRGPGVGRSGLPHQRGGAGALVLPDEIHFSRELAEPRFDRRAQFPDVLYLNRIIRGRARQPLEAGKDGRDRGLVIPRETRPRACSGSPRAITFGAADFQQQTVDLVFDLDGVNHQAIVFPGLVDKHDGGGADRNQHQESRRKQQDLANRPAARGVRRHSSLASSGRRIAAVPRSGKLPNGSQRRSGRLVPLRFPQCCPYLTAGPPPANNAAVASGVGTERIRKITPRRRVVLRATT